MANNFVTFSSGHIIGRIFALPLLTAAILCLSIPASGRTRDEGIGRVGCGIPCEPRVTIAIVLDGPSLLQYQDGSLTYVVTNRYDDNVAGQISISLGGAQLTDLNGNPLPPIMLTGKTPYYGRAKISAAKGGVAVATLFSPLFCVPLKYHSTHLTCTGHRQLAYTTAELNVIEDADHDGIPDSLEKQLLATFTPLMLFSTDMGQSEQYAPMNVLNYIRQSALMPSDDENQTPLLANSVLAAAPLAVLSPDGQNEADFPTTRMQSRFSINPNNAARAGDSWASVESLKNDGLYGHVTLYTSATDQPTYNGFHPVAGHNYYKVEYWQFFGYSHDLHTSSTAADKTVVPADHEGDWCTVQLLVDATLFAQQGTSPVQAIVLVWHYAHGLEFQFDMTMKSAATWFKTQNSSLGTPSSFYYVEYTGSNSSQQPSIPLKAPATDQNVINAQNNRVRFASDPINGLLVHPMVYVEFGGHEFWPTDGWSYQFAANHGGDAVYYIAEPPPNLGEVSDFFVLASDPASTVIRNFTGLWGAYGGALHLNPPPPGPPFHRQWLWPADSIIGNVFYNSMLPY